MPDMENFHAFVSFHDSVYYAIDVRLVAIKQMPEIRFRRSWGIGWDVRSV
jgi:hypothetical protein